MLSAEGAGFEWQKASPEAIAEAFKASQATSAPLPADWSGYGENIAEQFTEWLESAMRPLFRFIGPEMGTVLKWCAIGFAVLILALLVVRIIDSLRRRAQSSAPGADVARAPAEPALSLAQYREAARRELEKGDLRTAVTAIWWWFGASVLKTRPESAMTTHDVLSRSQRFDLRPFAQTLDRLRFAPQEPAAAEVRHLLSGLESSL